MILDLHYYDNVNLNFKRNELQFKVKLSDEELKTSLNELMNANIVVEKKSKHEVLGYTYSKKIKNIFLFVVFLH